jgi:hypothetical protein
MCAASIPAATSCSAGVEEPGISVDRQAYDAGPRVALGQPVLVHPLRRLLRQQPSDPISGSSPLRASVCNVAPLAAAERDSKLA